MVYMDILLCTCCAGDSAYLRIVFCFGRTKLQNYVNKLNKWGMMMLIF